MGIVAAKMQRTKKKQASKTIIRAFAQQNPKAGFHIPARRAATNAHGLSLFTVKFCCPSDTYTTSLDGVVVETTRGFKSKVHACRNVQRTTEAQWGMCYLSRLPRCGPSCAGVVAWKVELGSARMRVSSVRVKATHALWRDGAVKWSLAGRRDKQMSLQMKGAFQARELETVPVALGGDDFVDCDEIVRGWTEILFIAELSGAEGPYHQNAQLFRSQLSSVNAGFELQVAVVRSLWCPSAHRNFPLSLRVQVTAILMLAARGPGRRGSPSNPFGHLRNVTRVLVNLFQGL